MAKVQESRFALLHVEDDSDEDSTPAQAKKPNQPVKATQKKQKNKKKKQSQAQAENEQVLIPSGALGTLNFLLLTQKIFTYLHVILSLSIWEI